MGARMLNFLEHFSVSERLCLWSQLFPQGIARLTPENLPLRGTAQA